MLGGGVQVFIIFMAHSSKALLAFVDTLLLVPLGLHCSSVCPSGIVSAVDAEIQTLMQRRRHKHKQTQGPTGLGIKQTC